MGEYVKHKKLGSIKLGTCEDLYYVTFAQMIHELPNLSKLEGNDYPMSYIGNNSGYRFRFPFPNEDNVNIGSHQDFDKSLVIMIPEKFWQDISVTNHDKINITLAPKAGGHQIGVGVPCPYDPHFNDLKPAQIGRKSGFFPSYNYWNPFYAIVALKQQKYVDNELQIVLTCPYCGTCYRIERAEAALLVRSIRIFHHDREEGNYNFWMEVCRRIISGYQLKKHPESVVL